jgi:hypothetical protein
MRMELGNAGELAGEGGEAGEPAGEAGSVCSKFNALLPHDANPSVNRIRSEIIERTLPAFPNPHFQKS